MSARHQKTDNLFPFDSITALRSLSTNPLSTIFALRLASQDSFESWSKMNELEHRDKARAWGERFNKFAVFDACDRLLFFSIKIIFSTAFYDLDQNLQNS